ncbi:MAG: glycoside hydrolase family 1 [Opitutaceae bacterium]|nr:glycoside hydrolase family 1 [Opitutaceae bacterium]
MAESQRIVRAWLETPASGVIELDRDWQGTGNPRFSLGRHCLAPAALSPAPALAAALAYGYVFNPRDGTVLFVLPLQHGCDVNPARDTVYLAGDFNGWEAAVGDAAWQLKPTELEGEKVLAWSGDAARFLGVEQKFKFVTGEHQWLQPPDEAPNLDRDGDKNVNRVIDPQRTGWHLWRFRVNEPLSLAETWTVGWADELGDRVRLVPGNFFYELKTDLPLGAIVRAGQTVFRLFAPRARGVMLWIARSAAAKAAKEAQRFTLQQVDAAGVWEIALDHNLHGWFYWFTIDAARDEPVVQAFDPGFRILDPYALATVGRDGPGIVIDRAQIARPADRFRTPAWQDLVMAEAHVRDLVALAPIKAGAEERRGFTGLRAWVESPDFHLHHLGVNCVELQPVHEFDNVTTDEYHWGYMTNNFFAPESSYALEPEKASGVREFQEVVAAFHRRGMAVVLDVVFNHVGLPAHLMAIDRLYYFEQDAGGALTNWSGCGNDLRARSAMARRLIIDSCTHYIETYGVDGFRFDLAELLGVEVLREIETALKRVKPDVILIAEPWSFRGHIAGALRDTGWASWNDGYRDFVRGYVRGHGDAARMEYFLRGSPWYFAKWPSQTVNYTESHDDRCWIDAITDNPNHDGFEPTERDRRRTHLMAALLFMSVGIPMIAAGQDFLRSKRGVNNTYQRGDLNALDYRRLHRHSGTHAYFADWIAFRRSEHGRLLRQWARPAETFFRSFTAAGTPALAALYNADLSQGSVRLLFAINPSTDDATVPVGDEIVGEGATWELLANHDRFYAAGARGARRAPTPELWMPPLSCALWISGH